MVFVCTWCGTVLYKQIVKVLKTIIKNWVLFEFFITPWVTVVSKNLNIKVKTKIKFITNSFLKKRSNIRIFQIKYHVMRHHVKSFYMWHEPKNIELNNKLLQRFTRRSRWGRVSCPRSTSCPWWRCPTSWGSSPTSWSTPPAGPWPGRLGMERCLASRMRLLLMLIVMRLE